MLALKGTSALLPLRSTQAKCLRRTAHVCRATYEEPQQVPLYQSNVVRASAQQEGNGNFGGALCTLVLGSVLLGERLNGEGLVHALELHNDAMHPVLMATVAGLLLAAVWPARKTVQAVSGAGRIQKIASRIAYLGLAGTIAAEMWTGKVIISLEH